jgi:hypothetical protein
MSEMTMFDKSPFPTDKKLANFTKYVPRKTLARFLVQCEIFKRQLDVKGSIVECGVHLGGGVMTWSKLSAILEPYHYHRKIIGFDTFEGFPAVSAEDKGAPRANVGEFREQHDIYQEMLGVIETFDAERYINHIPKVELVKGDANQTIPTYLENNKHLIVSLLYLDFDVFQPTKTALQSFLPRIPKGGIIAFDEVNNKNWPGETIALLESFNLNQHKLECCPFEPNISFIQI